jgi:DNA-3-methyladenine glycosylase II
MTSHVLGTRGPFSLAQTRAFLEGWAPADARLAGGVLRVAFALDDGEHAAAALVTQDDEAVRAELQTGGDPDAAAAQLARMLSLDVDATQWPAAGERDPVLGELQRRRPGFRPVLFGSPFEAAVWSLLSQRTGLPQAARLRRRLAEQQGIGFDVAGERLYACPPLRLLELRELAGLPAPKLPRLRVLAEAALDGRLDASELRALPADVARERLLELPGIGPFSANLILLRGVGLVDELPTEPEPRLARALQPLYDLPQPVDAPRLRAIAEAWRPFRTWGCVLARASAADGGTQPLSM